eukprot:8523431-Lingulodinium_polyedra.AAC.1
MVDGKWPVGNDQLPMVNVNVDVDVIVIPNERVFKVLVMSMVDGNGQCFWLASMVNVNGEGQWLMSVVNANG